MANTELNQLKHPTYRDLEVIADDLDFGMKCFFNIFSGKVLSLPDKEDEFLVDHQLLPDEEEECNKMKIEPEAYIEIRKMKYCETYKLMESFVEHLEDHKMYRMLGEALRGRRPFQKFKHLIEHTGFYREKWLEYRRIQLVNWVNHQIEENIIYRKMNFRVSNDR